MAEPWWRGAIIYQIYPRSFLDSNGDGIGDLPGIVDRLDYVASLGVDAIWLSPFFKSPMKDYGYDVEDYRAVDPMFGSNDDFQRLLDGAHERGLKVIIDLVLCHSSDQHAWFKESRRSRDNPKADWYVWANAKPDGTPPNNWLSVFGGPAWTWEPRRRQYYLHHFLRSQPNINWHAPEAIEAMLGEVRFWLERGVDGLRLDAITTLVHDPDLRDNPARASYERRPDTPGTLANPFLSQIHQFSRDQNFILPLMTRLRRLTDQFPDRYMLGEVGDVISIDVAAKYTQGHERLHSCYTFEFMHPQIGVSRLKEVIGRIEATIGDGWITHAFSNHDVTRTVTRWGRQQELDGNPNALAKLLIACLTSLRGGACLYQGEELALPEGEIPFERLRDPWGFEFWPEFKGRDGCRTPMPWTAAHPQAGFSAAEPWLPIPQAHRALAVDQQEGDPESVLNACRRFLKFRKGHPALIVGATRLVPSGDTVLAFERECAEERLLCAFNISNAPAELEVSGSWRGLDGHGLPTVKAAKDTIELPAFGAFFGRPA